MFRTFKSLELFRHQIASRVDKSLKQYAKESKNSADKIVSTVFSACTSLAITTISVNFIQAKELTKGILALAIYLLAYSIVYLCYKRVVKFSTRLHYNIKRHDTSSTAIDIKEAIDDFDHIACDNVLLAKEFIKKYEKEKDFAIKEFYFYETIYYLKVSIRMTLRVVEKDCINTTERTTNVDLFRVVNIAKNMKDILGFIKQHVNDEYLDITRNLRLILLEQIYTQSDTGLEYGVNEILKTCQTHQNQYFADQQMVSIASKYSKYLKDPPTE